MAIFEFNPTIYPRRLWVVKGNDNEFVKDKFCKRDGSDIDFYDNEDDNPSLCTVFGNIKERETGNFGMLVCIYEDVQLDHIAHEAYHIASEIFRDIGAEHDIDNQEPAAYLIGWCARCISSANESKSEMIPAVGQ